MTSFITANFADAHPILSMNVDRGAQYAAPLLLTPDTRELLNMAFGFRENCRQAGYGEEGLIGIQGGQTVAGFGHA